MFYDLFFDKGFADVNRVIKDNHPYQIINGENKDTIIINALGVSEDNIKIDIKSEGDRAYLQIDGNTHNEITNEDYSFKNRFSINKLKVKEVKYYSKDGLLYIDVIYKETPIVEIPISKN
jgi:HSP20 family molecular chaperone IbpA